MSHLPKSLWLPLLFVCGIVFGTSRQGAFADDPVATLIRWPYLQQVTTNSAFVIWTTDIQGEPALAYFNHSAVPHKIGIVSRKIHTSNGNYYEHKAVINGLNHESWYYYKIFDGDENLSPAGAHWFQTASSNGEFTFAAFGDSGDGTPAQYRLRDLMQERWRDIQLFIHTGDLAYPHATFDQFEQRHFAVYRELFATRPLFPSMGNHAYDTDDGQPYLQVFDLPKNAWDLQDMERYYSFDWGAVHFVALDTEDPLERISDESDVDMADWLAADLAADDHIWKIVYFHRPPYSSCPKYPDTDVRENLVPIFETYGVDLVLSGHYHNYERTHPIRDGAISTPGAGGVVYVVTGGGGNAYLYPPVGDWFTAAAAELYHFVQVRVTNRALFLTVIDEYGALIDSAVLRKFPHRRFLPVVTQN